MSSDPHGELRLAWSRIEARGADAREFLQGQLTQDLDGVDARAALVLSPDGAVIADLTVSVAPEGYDLVVASDLADATLTRLRRFLLRVDCTFEVVAEADGRFATLAERVDAAWPGANEYARALSPHSFGAAFVEQTVSFTKGCYPGQEIVARLDSRGARVPFRLVVARGESVVAIDAVLRAAGPAGPSGVTSSVERDGVVFALGFAHRSLTDGEHDAVSLLTA
ncbi:MAG: hypothetical protein ACRDV0_10400 [Acidimicrobiales bacterium]